MANTLAPIGFLHQGSTEGSSPTFGQKSMLIASGDTAAVFRGDPVKMISTGYVAAWTAGTAVSQLAGIFMGCQYQGSAGQGLIRSNYWPGSGSTGDVTAFILPCNLGSGVPLFLVQAIGATGILFADIGANVDVTMGSGSTITGLSAAGVTQSTLAATATLPFRVVGYNAAVGPAISPSGASNDLTAANDWVYVAANVAGAGSTGI